jgi:hypothetical protein
MANVDIKTALVILGIAHIGMSISAGIILRENKKLKLQYLKLSETTLYMYHILEENQNILDQFDWIALQTLINEVNDAAKR